MKPTETLGEEDTVVWNQNEFSLFIIPWLCSVSSSVLRETTHLSCWVMRRCLIRQAVLCHLKRTVWLITFLKLRFRAAGENSKLGHAVGDLSCVNQPSLCLLSATSKDVCFVLSALHHLLPPSHYLRSCFALNYLFHQFSFKPVTIFNVVQY